ncbi:hypothetical protein [Streptomyces clavuligerus]|uniref:Uncharacterized protein n=1 Tax=Streptomyces clavuligerus TaxID=1901 RepID=E2Q5V0_STRCL|nr:hypothetical protein [Streptomyces clavuligerus]ANW21703.1 hypothetical protein BB341_27555 [Streptomyces clavuligerus]AXU16332.1 hypothetical protein D1794_28625 [Streptomyces clavuligerus]EFG05110.1 Hypothetical protein SCLAV_0034 [Streptomyces clavuligerus]MBY6306493.1 hypothetical protein [Streptomyces clavuligerus]QCS09112.1 hypothetical protein CRV15_27985 [Streptomyces clavuligerus]
MENPPERGGILIVRVWVEEGRSDGFRARVIRSVDGQGAPSAATSTVDDVLTLVRCWLLEILGPDG